jgi:hypothetical protein
LQKLVLQKLTASKIPSNKASQSTVRRRSKEINNIIHSVSSPDPSDEEAAIHQLAALLKGKSTTELKEIIKDKGILNIRIPAGEELVLKAQMGWSWSVLRSLKRYSINL